MPRYRYKRHVKSFERKVWVRAFLASILDLPEWQVGRLFGWRGYDFEVIHRWLLANGYTPPPKRPRGRPKKSPPQE